MFRARVSIAASPGKVGIGRSSGVGLKIRGMEMALAGRISQRRYLLTFFVPAALFLLAVVLVAPPLQFSLWFSVAFLLLMPLWIYFGSGRCHDIDRTAWFLLIFLIPVLGPFWVHLELCLRRGSKGQNRFGDSAVPASLIAEIGHNGSQ